HRQKCAHASNYSVLQHYLAQNRTTGIANRLQNAQLAPPLQHRQGHRVRNDNDASEERERGDGDQCQQHVVQELINKVSDVRKIKHRCILCYLSNLIHRLANLCVSNLQHKDAIHIAIWTQCLHSINVGEHLPKTQTLSCVGSNNC